MMSVDDVRICTAWISKKLSYRRPRDRASVETLPIATQQCRNYTCTTSPEQIEVIKLEGYSGTMCNKHVHSTMTRSIRFHCPVGVINKPTTDEFWTSCGYHLYTDDLLWRNFLSPQCRNCSPDPDHATFREYFFSSAGWDNVPNFKSLGSPVTKLRMAVQNAENGVVWSG